MFSLEGYRALRQTAGVVRRGDRGLLAVTGPDRLIWLQGLLTNDVLALGIGGVCDAAYLTPQGRMITDLRVVNLAEKTLLDVPGSLAEELRARLDGLIFSEDAQVADLSPTLVMIDLHGPQAGAVRGRAAVGSKVMAVAADAPFGVPSISFWVSPAEADAVVSALVANGAVETTLATLDVLRIEAGRPAFLIDMNDHTIPLEAGIEDRAISFTKGCYVGQEVIVRVTHRGHGRVAKRLVGLTLAPGTELPQAGNEIAAGDRSVGHITSAAWSPALERGIALGYVHRDYVEPGTQLQVRAGNRTLEVTVSSLPFVTVGPA